MKKQEKYFFRGKVFTKNNPKGYCIDLPINDWTNKTKEEYVNKQIELFDNKYYWYNCNKKRYEILHRENGPAVYFYYYKYWYINGKFTLIVPLKYNMYKNSIYIEKVKYFSQYDNKVFVILKKLRYPHNKVYLCLFENEKKHVIFM